MKRFYRWAGLGAVLFLSGCTPATIAVSPDLVASTQAIDIMGMGFGETGQFTFGESRGSFYRSTASQQQGHPRGERETVTYGNGGFRVAGPEAGVLEGSCLHDEVEVGNRSISVTTAPFLYRCTFHEEGRPSPATLVLSAAPRPVGGLVTTEGRRGHLEVDGRTVTIEPIYTSANSAILMGDALGYRFVEAGRELGAIDLNGERKRVYLPVRPEDRRAVLMGSLALSILWRS